MVTPRKRRLYLVLGGMSLLGSAVCLVIFAFQDNLVFFYSPTEIAQERVPSDQRIRVGGLVEEGSVISEGDGLTTRFHITDLSHTLPVTYTGILPSLFREGQGVIVQGYLQNSTYFVADEVLAKHDENYMPPEVAEALKKSGRWKEKAE